MRMGKRACAREGVTGSVDGPSPPLPPPSGSDSPATRPRWTRRVPFIGKLLVSVGLLAWIIQRASLSEVLISMREADPRLVAAAFGLNMVGWTISVLRWRVLLRAADVEVRFPVLLQSYLSGIFFNNLLPSTVGGDTLRMYDSWRWGAGRAGAVAVIAVDRLTGVLALLLFALAALVLAPQIIQELPLLPLWVGMGAAGVLGIAALSLLPLSGFRRRAEPWFDRLPEIMQRPIAKASGALQAYRDDSRALRKALALSVLLQFNVILHFWLIATAMALPVGLMAFFLIIPISLAVMTIPLSVNAVGIRENVFAFFLAFYGVGPSGALAFAWIAFGLILVQGVIGGIVYALRRTPLSAELSDEK
jgi:glycosyltransferase 2 family protein